MAAPGFSPTGACHVPLPALYFGHDRDQRSVAAPGLAVSPKLASSPPPVRRTLRLGYRSMLDDGACLGHRTSGYELESPVMLAEDDRRRHLYIVGKTGTGKSTLLLSLMLADLFAGKGLALLDPN